MIKRCFWAIDDTKQVYQAYHDKEWGVPIHDDRLLFEFLSLEGAQAGLSWATILAKREHYREAFDHFHAETIVTYDQQKLDELLQNAGIVRNKSKISSVITNAQAFLAAQEEYGSFNAFIWSFVDGKTVQNAWESRAEIPAKTDISDRLSKALIKRGFKFVGSTICYAFMQAVGMVNDHTTDCFRYYEVQASD